MKAIPAILLLGAAFGATFLVLRSGVARRVPGARRVTNGRIVPGARREERDAPAVELLPYDIVEQREAE